MAANDVLYGFDTTDAQDQKWIDRIAKYKKSRAMGVPHDLVRHTKRTKVGQDFAVRLAQAMNPDQPYSAHDLCRLLGPGWTPRRVASKLNSLGRVEARHGGIRVFGRPADGQYSMSPKMRDALLDPNI
jgi:hypothetical protein